MAQLPFQDPSLPVEQRVADLLSRMTIEEKVSQMNNHAPAIDRLGIPEYDWWNECLHGVGRAGRATVFPQAIGLAATWDEKLLLSVAEAISDEARAKYHAAQKMGNRTMYVGLTYWSPTINILRDPRWGRAQETYGEDPYLTSRLAVAFVKGLQGEDRRYLKLVATPKHFAAHSGPEKGRSAFDAKVSPKDLRETYLPAFRAAIVEGGAQSVMGAYNRLNGVPCCAHDELLNDILREEWGFNGYVVSDCGAIENIFSAHGTADTLPEAAAQAVLGGCDLCCGQAYGMLVQAVEQGLLSEADIDRALGRLLTARFMLGMFDPDEMVPWSRLGPEVVDCEQHRALASQAARESMVLLKNDGTLPLDPMTKKLLVVGPTAASLEPMLGNYNGHNPRVVTFLEGIVGSVSAGTRLNYHPGCPLQGQAKEDYPHVGWEVRMMDVIIACVGFTAQIEGEEGDAAESEAGGDRVGVELPEVQKGFLRWLCTLGKPVVAVVTAGSPVALGPEFDGVSAVLLAWYPGEEGGQAAADILFGRVNPSGRLPVTVPRHDAKLPAFEDYSMVGRTYRYSMEEPQFPFGYGLSYTTYEVSGLELPSKSIKAGEPISLSCQVTNSGSMAGEQVVQVYLRDLETSCRAPRHSLVGFQRVRLASGETKTVEFELKAHSMELVLEDGTSTVEPGEFEVFVGGSQPGYGPTVSARFRVE